jgi:hypothetical protein
MAVRSPLRLFVNSQRSRLSLSSVSHSPISTSIQARMVATSAPRNNQAKTFAYDDKLPRLPVPDLENSLKGYVQSLTPVLEQKVSCVATIHTDKQVDTSSTARTPFPRSSRSASSTPRTLPMASDASSRSASRVSNPARSTAVNYLSGIFDCREAHNIHA